MIPVWQILPSPENDDLYRPVQEHDPEIRSLAESIRQHGVQEPLILTADHYIISGHRCRMTRTACDKVPDPWAHSA